MAWREAAPSRRAPLQCCLTYKLNAAEHQRVGVACTTHFLLTSTREPWRGCRGLNQRSFAGQGHFRVAGCRAHLLSFRSSQVCSADLSSEALSLLVVRSRDGSWDSPQLEHGSTPSQAKAAFQAPRETTCARPAWLFRHPSRPPGGPLRTLQRWARSSHTSCSFTPTLARGGNGRRWSQCSSLAGRALPRLPCASSPSRS